MKDPGILLAAVVFLYCVTPVHNGNFFWHLRNGIDIVETGEIRTEDPFTWTMRGADWIQQEWLAEAAMALTWIHLGEPGPVLLKALLVALSAFLAYRASVRSGADRGFALVFGAAWLALAQPRWIVRPHFFSIFFFSVFLYVLSFRHRKPWQLALILFPLQALWANTHAGFIMGIFLSAVPAMDRLLRGKVREGLDWSLPPVVMIAASGVHPNGFRSLEYLPGFLSMPLYRETIREWWSPFDPRYSPEKAVSRTAMILTGLTAVTTVLLVFFRKRIEWGRTSALAVLTAATVFAARNGEFLAPAMMAWIPGMTRIRLRTAFAMPLIVVLAAVPFIYGVPREIGPPRQLGASVDWSIYPVQAADLLESRPGLLENSVLFNTNEISGYLEYRFGERLPLFMDGRCPIFPEDFYRDYLTLTFPTGPAHLAQQYGLFERFGFNLLIYNTPVEGSVYLAALLPEWKPLYFDGLIVVYATEDLLETAGAGDLAWDHFDPFAPEELLSEQLYLIPADALDELERANELIGNEILGIHTVALRFRMFEEELPETPDTPAGFTLECWRSCREGNLEEAMEYAVLSGDAQLETAVRILQGCGFQEDDFMMGIRPGMIRVPEALTAVDITALWVTGQQRAALDLAEVSLDSLNGWGTAQCGLLYSLAGEGEKALELAEKALELASGPVVLERAAAVHFREGDPETAAALCEEALELSPGFTGATLLLGNCLWEQGMISEAAVRYTAVKDAGLELPQYAQQRLELVEAIH